MGKLTIGFAKFRNILNSNNIINRNLRTHISTNTQLVVVDEAHKSLAKTYQEAINFVSNMPDCRILGLTATPGRSADINDDNNQALADLFHNNTISVTDDYGNRVTDALSYLQENEVLAKLNHKPIVINIDNLTVEQLRKISIERALDNTHIDQIIVNPVRNKILVDEVENMLNDSNKDHVLIFACNTQHCYILKKLLNLKGINSEIVLSDTNYKKRRKIISDFKEEKLKVLINYGVLTTGFDAPKLKSLIIARHTNSLILYSQMIGRALRGPKNGGNKENYVVDLIDNIVELGSPQFLFSYWEDFWQKNITI